MLQLSKQTSLTKITSSRDNKTFQGVFLPLLVAGKTDIGLKRSTNQDAILLDSKNLLYIVADGMGGHKAGDVASTTAIQKIGEYVRTHSSSDPKRLLNEAILHVNAALYLESEKNPDLKGMGTTVVSALFKGNYLYLANVGDSRAYLINKGELFQLTKDHTLIQEKISLGIYSREEAHKDKMKNVLIRTVGYEEKVEVDLFTYKVARHDLFLLCSDGLHGRLSDQQILNQTLRFVPDPALAHQDDLEQLVNALISLSNENGGQDNISVVACLAQ